MDDAVIAELAASVLPYPTVLRNGSYVIDGASFPSREDAVAFLAELAAGPSATSKDKNPNGGLSAAGHKKFGTQPGVKNYSSASDGDKKRWVRWALRFTKTPQPLKDDSGKPTRYALMFQAWGEPIPTSPAAVSAVHTKAVTRSKQLKMGDNADLAHGNFMDAHHAMRKPHKHRAIHGNIHTSFVYGGAGSINGGGVHDPRCADCGQPGDSPGHSDAPAGGGDSGPSTSGGTATALLEAAGGYPCPCGRDFASATAFARHMVTFAKAEDPLTEEALSMNDGKFPITDQKSANSAWKLRNHSSDHSEESVVAHIRRAVNKLGLKMPGSDSASHDFACLPCERWFGTEDALVGHLKVLHR